MIRYGGANSMCLWPAFSFSTLAIMWAGCCSTHVDMSSCTSHQTLSGSWLGWSSGQNQANWVPTSLLDLHWQGIHLEHHDFEISTNLLQICVHPAVPDMQRSSGWSWTDWCVHGFWRCLHHHHGTIQVNFTSSFVHKSSFVSLTCCFAVSQTDMSGPSAWCQHPR